MLYDLKMSPAQAASIAEWMNPDPAMAPLMIAKRDGSTTIDVGQGDARAAITIDGLVLDDENASETRARREKHMHAAFKHFGIGQETDCVLVLSEMKRYLGVQDGGINGWFAFGADTPDDAFGYFGEEIVAGWQPEALYDLDTGESIPIAVGVTPVYRGDDTPTNPDLS